MKTDLTERVLLVAKYFKSNEKTVRETAKEFNISKSTVHLDLTKRLKKIDGKLYDDVEKILKKNFKEKHLRGGNATREKYAANKKIK